MDIEGVVVLGEIHHNGRIGCKAISEILIVIDMIANKLVLVLLIDIHHVSEALVNLILAVREEAVGRYGLIFIIQGRAAQENGFLRTGVVIAIGGMHHISLIDNH